jgi:hypothetical protein
LSKTVGKSTCYVSKASAAQRAVSAARRKSAEIRPAIRRQPHLDRGCGRAQQERDQPGVAMKPGDAAAALAHCVEQPVDPLVQLIVQCEREHTRFQRIQPQGLGDRLDPAIGAATNAEPILRQPGMGTPRPRDRRGVSSSGMAVSGRPNATALCRSQFANAAASGMRRSTASYMPPPSACRSCQHSAQPCGTN